MIIFIDNLNTHKLPRVRGYLLELIWVDLSIHSHSCQKFLQFSCISPIIHAQLLLSFQINQMPSGKRFLWCEQGKICPLLWAVCHWVKIYEMRIWGPTSCTRQAHKCYLSPALGRRRQGKTLWEKTLWKTAFHSKGALTFWKRVCVSIWFSIIFPKTDKHISECQAPRSKKWEAWKL